MADWTHLGQCPVTWLVVDHAEVQPPRLLPDRDAEEHHLGRRRRKGGKMMMRKERKRLA